MSTVIQINRFQQCLKKTSGYTQKSIGNATTTLRNVVKILDSNNILLSDFANNYNNYAHLIPPAGTTSYTLAGAVNIVKMYLECIQNNASGGSPAIDGGTINENNENNKNNESDLGDGNTPIEKGSGGDNGTNGSLSIELPLNQILYGPPGTGKTYNTINKAIEIIENRKVLDNEDRKGLKACFEKYKKNGQIEFVTFHQSYGYEEFVEGIKAITDNNQITYNVENGIFKKLCESALTKTNSSVKYITVKNKIQPFTSDYLNNRKVWGVHYGQNNTIQNDWYVNNKINFVFTNYPNDLFTYNNVTHFQLSLKQDMKIGDLVVVKIQGDSYVIEQVGIIKSDYKYDQSNPRPHYREVEWIFCCIRHIDVGSYCNNSKIRAATFVIADMTPNDDKNKADFLDCINQYICKKELISEEKTVDVGNNVVLIIDEINRGNISKIFGELITLIEPSKRIGAGEEIRVKLPYSGDSEDPFGVPQNLYIIGTMNTADRSIAQIDTALRRRFVFEEMVPNSSLLSTNIEGVDLQSLLEAINTRIEYLYDRDHTIGHAYLIDVKTLDDLRFAFKNKIIPLLAEYFYEDWENIDWVLNKNGFIKTKEDNNNKYLAVVNKKISGKTIYEVSNENDWKIDNFKKIYDDQIDLAKKAEDTSTNEVNRQSNNG